MTAPRAPRRPDAAPEAARSGWILAVDDEPAICRLLGRLLRRHGYRVVIAHTGAEAIASLESSDEAPGLVIVDMLLPDTEGIHVLGAARTLHPGVPVILTSGLSQDEVQVFEANADRFLEKPFSADELLTCVRELMEE